MVGESFTTKKDLETLPSGEDLRQRLLAGMIGAHEFLHGIFKLDQSTDERTDAAKNVEILKSPEVAEFFNKNKEQQSEYFYMLSFSYFHKGGIPSETKEYSEALESFRASLDAANQMETGYQQPWKDYVGGVVAYFEKDLPKLKMIHENMQEDGRNKWILKSCINQLEAGRGHDFVAALIAAER